MKVKFLAGLCLFAHISLQAQQMKTFSDLKKGDWFALEYIQFQTSPDRNQSLRDADIYEYQITVSERTNDDLQFAIRNIRVCSHKTRTNHPRGGVSEAGFFDYFDSHYFNDFVLENPYYYGSRDVVTFKLNLRNGIVRDTVYNVEKNRWQYPLELIEKGIKKKVPLLYARSGISKDAKSLFEDIIQKYFSNCSPITPLPWLLEGRLENDVTYRIQITSASFPLSPNVKLNYFSSEKISLEELILEVNYQTYDLQQDDNGFVRFEFFLPRPAMGKMINAHVSLTPGDSISIETDANGNVIFSGQGSGNCRYWHELSKHYSFFDQSTIHKGYTSNLSSSTVQIPLSPLEKYLSTGDSIFQALQHQYASQMSPYWLESSRLSFKYWYMYRTLQSHIRHNSIIDWKKEPFLSATPFTDYLFLPQDYTSFINLYSDYLRTELHREILSGTVNYHDNLLSQYYFQKGLFAGYPKYLMLSETLLKLAETASPTSFQNEFYDFITECKDPDLLQKVTQEYDMSIKSQPGKNIRDLQLSIENDLPLKKTADGYIVIIMGYLEGAGSEYKEAFEDMTDSLDAIGLQTKVQVIRPERYQGTTRIDTTNARLVVYFDDSEDLLKDCRILKSKQNSLLLIRNDGAIVTKNIFGYWTKNFNDEGKRKWRFRTESVSSFIQEDMKRNQKAGFNFTIPFIVLGTILISGGIAYIIYNTSVKQIRKREENKRLITELELKAIRSQMNPHFIFNALSSIQHLINQGKNSDANQYLLNFAKLLRMVLATSEKKFVSLADEIEQIELYLQLEQLRIPFNYRIEIDDIILPENEEIPGMLIQPVVENAVKHGISGNQDGTVTILFSKEAHVLLVEITDDGAGFSASSQSTSGFGLKATEERLRLINEDFKTNIGIRMERNHPVGTKVIISIPV